MGTLLRPMQRDTRTLAFGALANAANTIESARLILDRAKDALNLPDTRYPKETSVGTDRTVAASLAGVARRERATGGL